jgi:hypothetical protein
MNIKGQVVAETKVKNAEGMAVRITLDGGVYLEVSNIGDQAVFKKLCSLAEIDKKLRIMIEESK